MVEFNNVSIDYGNISNGPDSGRIYTLDHLSNTLIVKSFSTGIILTSIPTDSIIGNEVVSLQYDGYYFYSLQKIGLNNNLGIKITKWLLQNNLVVKQIGLGGEIQLVSNNFYKYDADAFCIERFVTKTNSYIGLGATSFIINSNTYLTIGDTLYFGVSTVDSISRMERKVTNIIGNTVYFDIPSDKVFNINDSVIYKKNIWLFNKYYLTNLYGNLIHINSLNGNILENRVSNEFKGVTASNCHNGNILFVRETQLLQYRPYGINAGYISSAILNNTEVDNNTTIRVYDFWTDSTTIYKLQLKQHQYDTFNFTYSDVISTNNKFNIDSESLLAKVFSITASRNDSYLFGKLRQETLSIKVTNQFDLPVPGRSISITENGSGYIEPGYSSFTTNANGEGITKYNLGLSTLSEILNVYARDIVSGLRVPIIINQLEKITTTTTVTQKSKISNNCNTIQYKLGNNFSLVQSMFTTNTAFITQLKLFSSCIVYQLLYWFKYYLNQNSILQKNSTVTVTNRIFNTQDLIQYPFLVYATPLPYSNRNFPDTNILLRVIEFDSPLNLNTLEFRVNGQVIENSNLIITPFTGGIDIFYNPPINFQYGSLVSISLKVNDTSNPVKVLSTYYTFNIIEDYKKPKLIEVYPPNKSSNNLKNTNIYCILLDQETGIDISSIELYVEGVFVIPVIEEIGDGKVKVSYTNLNGYFYNSTVSVGIKFKDNNNNKTLSSWEFNIEQSPGVLFINENPRKCDNLVLINSNICMEAFGLTEGINLSTVDYNIDSKSIEYAIIPKVYRIE